jgi:hypothetical protein
MTTIAEEQRLAWAHSIVMWESAAVCLQEPWVETGFFSAAGD